MKHRFPSVANAPVWRVWLIVLALALQPFGAAFHAAAMDAGATEANQHAMHVASQTAQTTVTGKRMAGGHQQPAGCPCCPDNACDCLAQCTLGCCGGAEGAKFAAALILRAQPGPQAQPFLPAGPEDFIASNRGPQPPPQIG